MELARSKGGTMRPARVKFAAVIAAVLVGATAAGCSGSSPSPGEPPSSGISSLTRQQLAASCTAFAASDRSSTPQLTFDIAKSLAGTAVPVCVVPKPGHDGLARLDGSTAKMTTAPEWAEAISFDRPLPSGVAVSLSYDAYAWVNGEWLEARMAGVGTNTG